MRLKRALDASWSARERLGGVLGQFWGVLKAFWDVLGGSWEGFGESSKLAGTILKELLEDFLPSRAKYQNCKKH